MDRFGKNSCSSFSLRVQSGHCVKRVMHSMCVSNKQPSITELNSTLTRSSELVIPKRRIAFETVQSCAAVSALTSSFVSQSFTSNVAANFLQTLARVPAFFYWVVHFSRARSALARQHRACGAMLTEFISVSGLRAERSALCSDLRLKRISGVVAATEHPYAPMNSSLFLGSAVLGS